MNREEVYNLACQMLGNFFFKEGAPTHDPCVIQYPHVLRVANAKYDWSFAQQRKALRNPERYPGGRWLYRLPSSCIKVRMVYDLTGTRRIELPEMVAGGLTVGEDGSGGVLVDYQADLVASAGELPPANPIFCDAVVTLLAARITPAIAGDARLAQALEQQANGLFLQAIAFDKQQDYSNARSPHALRQLNKPWD